MNDILQIDEDISFDESVTGFDVHTHQPYISTTFLNNDEIRIPIQKQDIYTLPSQSCILIEGKLMKEDGNKLPATSKFISNGITHLFDEIRYELNGIEIDRCKNVGITSTMKGLVSFNDGQIKMLGNAGWGESLFTDEEGRFNVSIPLNMILGFAEDYKKNLMNVKQELVLIRSKVDANSYVTANKLKLEINKIYWRMPYVYVNDRAKLRFLKRQERDKPIMMAFRSWELCEYPILPQQQKQTWSIKTSSQMEKPRYIILGFQTKRKNHDSANTSEFDHCNLANVKVYLNSQNFPYDNLNLKIKDNQYALLYEMYTQFQQSYYGSDKSQPLLNKHDFINKGALVVLDCSKQSEALKTAPVDVRLEFEANANFPADTTAYCLLIHDRIIEYNPITSFVKKLV